MRHRNTLMYTMGSALIGLVFLVSAGIASAQTATSTNTSSTTPMTTSTSTSSTASSTDTIQVMVHVCPSTVTSLDQIMGSSTSGNSPTMAQFATAEALCPTSVLPSNTPTPGTISGPQGTFDFTVTSGNTVYPLSGATYQQNKICENDLGTDINHDNMVSSTTCLDASDYAFSNIPTGQVMIKETMPPAGTSFGTFFFTPTNLMTNTAQNTYVSTTVGGGLGTIILNTASSTDSAIMLHIFELANATSTGTGTTTPMGGGTGTTTPTGGGTGTTTPTGSNTGGGSTITIGGVTFTLGSTSTTTISGSDALNTIALIVERVEDVQAQILNLLSGLFGVR